MDLLERENEFRKLNKQLEKKTEKLMKEIEIVMQKPDIFTDFSQNISLRLNSSEDHVKKHSCSTTKPDMDRPKSYTKIKNVALYEKEKKMKNNIHKKDNLNENDKTTIVEIEKNKNNHVLNEVKERKNFEISNRIPCDCCIQSRKEKLDPNLEFLYAFVSVSVKEKILPEFFLKGEVTIENICKCLSNKVKILQEQIDKLQCTLKKKESQCEQHLTKVAEMESERLALINKSNNCKTTATEMRNKCTILQTRLEEKERLYKEQRTETDKLGSEVKRLKSKVQSLEAKHASSQQAVENLTLQLQAVKTQEKEFKDNCRSTLSTYQSTITSLESTIKRQSSRIDRQVTLIDNLRRQIAVLTTEACVNALEKDYSAFLMQEIN